MEFSLFSLVLQQTVLLNVYVSLFQKVMFEHPVFHPVIDPKTGELDVKRGFQKWR